jgi:hypothetical protein
MAVKSHLPRNAYAGRGAVPKIASGDAVGINAYNAPRPNLRTNTTGRASVYDTHFTFASRNLLRCTGRDKISQ